VTPEEKAVVQAAIAWRHSLDNRSYVRIVGSPEDRLLNATLTLIYGCSDCNYGRHVCPGCGENIGHEDNCCIPYSIIAGGEPWTVAEVQELPLWVLSEWQHVIMGDIVRLPGRPETEASVGSVQRQQWHADSREYTGQDGKVRDWVTPHEHEIIFARLILDGSERTVNFPLETPVEILTTASRRAALTVQQAFPGSEVIS